MSRSRADRRRAWRRGRLAELLCRWTLRLKGYRVLAAGYRVPVGEIDVLARRGGRLVAVEVKVRADRAAALEAVAPRQRRRIERALQWYLGSDPRAAPAGVRFDIFAVAPWRLPAHIEDAWRLGE